MSTTSKTYRALGKSTFGVVVKNKNDGARALCAGILHYAVLDLKKESYVRDVIPGHIEKKKNELAEDAKAFFESELFNLYANIYFHQEL